MPNWCYNRVEITADDAILDQIEEVFSSDHPFAQLLPEPDWANTPDANGIYPGPRYATRWGVDCSRFPNGRQDDRWYNWRIVHWGTKWDICDIDIESTSDGNITLQFDTAWCPPEGIFHALGERFPDAEISWHYDEPGCALSGYLGED